MSTAGSLSTSAGYEIEQGFKGTLFVTIDTHTHETVPVARRHAPPLR